MNIELTKTDFKTSEFRIISLAELKRITKYVYYEPTDGYTPATYSLVIGGTYFSVLAKIYAKDITKVHKWKQAFAEAGYIIGWKGIQNDILDYAAWIIENRRG